MNTLQNKINDLIKESYTVQFSGSVEVARDNYEEGEIEDFVNSWTLETTIYKTHDLNDIKILFYKYIEDNYILYGEVNDQDLTLIDSRICLGQAVNVNNNEPTHREIEQFKQGEIDLYNQHIDIIISINGSDLTEEILAEIFPTTSR